MGTQVVVADTERTRQIQQNLPNSLLNWQLSWKENKGPSCAWWRPRAQSSLFIMQPVKTKHTSFLNCRSAMDGRFWHRRSQRSCGSSSPSPMSCPFMGDLVYKGPSVVVPVGDREHLLEHIHSSHMITSVSMAACEAVFWPGMTSQIKDRVQRCGVCQEFQAANQCGPLQSHNIPSRPWEKVAVDLFTLKDRN